MIDTSTGTAEIPLSFNQDVQILGEWLASLRSELPPRLSPHCAYYWEGVLDIPVLQQALDALVARHEALRTAFPNPAAVPPSAAVQVARRLASHDLFSSSLFKASVRPAAACPLRMHDELMGHTVDDPAVMAALHAAARQPVGESGPPQVRVSVFRLTPTSGVLLIGTHHLITDNWSVRLMQRDLGTLYRHFCGDATAALPPLDMQYSDVSAWQRRQFISGGFDKAIAYWLEQWREYFPGRMTLDDLPLARRQQTAPPSSAAATETVTLDGDAYRSIRDFAVKAEATSYTFWLCALAILFHGYSGKQKITFFSNTAGRTLAPAANIVGLFANSSLVGLRVAPHEPALAVLQRVRASALEAQQREELPLGALWGLFLKDGRFQELSRGDWIAMNFGEHRRIRVEHWGVDGLAMRPLDLGLSSRTNTAVNIGIMNRGDRFVVSCVYHGDRLASADVRRLLDDLQRVSTRLVASPDDTVESMI